MASTPENYKAERIKHGLSQAALAALVGVSRGCINYREAGHPRYPITTEAWLAICSLPQAKARRPRKGQNAERIHGYAGAGKRILLAS